jgi:hypothetical protein
MEKDTTVFTSLEAEVVEAITKKHFLVNIKAPTIGGFNPHMGQNQSWFSVQSNIRLDLVAETIKSLLTGKYSAKVSIVNRDDDATFVVSALCEGKFLRITLSFDTDQNTMILSIQM